MMFPVVTRGDSTELGGRQAGAELWRRAGVGPEDMDCAQIYDCFTISVILQLEAYGFCGPGEAKDLIADGGIELGGRLPVNTHGGQLSAGRLHGFGFIHEACVQLWGEAGDRQVPNGPEVGVACAGGGPLAGALLLTRRR
jgi:acetyl-CoA acetyltransferase